MSNRYVFILLVIIAVGITSGAYILEHTGRSTSTLTTASSEENIGSLAGCTTPSIAYVYTNNEQKARGDDFLNTFNIMANNAGIDLSNVGKCFVNASDLGVKLRLYPSLIVVGNISGLKDVVLNDQELPVIDYQISMYIARMMRIPIEYTYTAEAIVVNGTTPYTSIGGRIIESEAHRELFSLLAEANITNIRVVSPEQLPFQTKFKPSLVFRSSYNLSRGAPYIEQRAGDYYVIRETYMLDIIQGIIGSRGVELSEMPRLALRDYPAIGSSNAPLRLYIFEDYYCPYCARLYHDDYDLMMRYIDKDKLRVYFVDLIVHIDALQLHSLTKCLYNITGNATLYAELTRLLYENYTSSQEKPGLEYLYALASKYVDNATLEKAKACSSEESNKIMSASSYYRSQGIRATPTLLFWRADKGMGLLITGYLEPSEFEECISMLLSR